MIGASSSMICFYRRAASSHTKLMPELSAAARPSASMAVYQARARAVAFREPNGRSWHVGCSHSFATKLRRESKDMRNLVYRDWYRVTRRSVVTKHAVSAVRGVARIGGE